METCRRRETCRLCGGGELTCVLALTPTPPANAFVDKVAKSEPQPCFPLDVFFCETCKHVQLLDVVDPAVLFENYVYVSGTSPAFVKHFSDYANAVTSRFGPAPGSLAVDIGSNDGTLLGFFKERGLRVLGIDPAENIAADDPLKPVTDAARYLGNNLKRMDYPRYRRLGLPVTSAPMESLIKQMNARVKGTEMFWDDPEGAESILHIRAAALSEDGRLDDYLATRPGYTFLRRSTLTNLSA